MRDNISALLVIFRGCPLLQEEGAEKERLHGFTESDRHRTTEGSNKAFPLLFYGVSIRVYGPRLSKKHRHRFGLPSGAEEDRNRGGDLH